MTGKSVLAVVRDVRDPQEAFMLESIKGRSVGSLEETLGGRGAAMTLPARSSHKGLIHGEEGPLSGQGEMGRAV